MKTISNKWWWCGLIILTFLITGFLIWLKLPAALLLGPMLAGIVISLFGATLSIPKPCFSFSQTLLGCFIAQTLSAKLLMDLAAFWHLALLITLSTLIISVILGKLLTRFSPLPGTTGTWGILPGGASAMAAICGDFGADMRLVALIQYLRLTLVVLSVTLISHFSSHAEPADSIIHHVEWFPPLTLNLAYTLLIAVAAYILSKYLKIPSGRMLIAMIAGGILQINGVIALEMPPWLLAFSFAVIGFSAGLRFNMAVLKLALKSLPMILLSIFVMIIFCYFQAIILSDQMKIDFLTAILATSPGGLETAVIIASETDSIVSIIAPLQILRLFSVLLLGPMIARLVTREKKASL